MRTLCALFLAVGVYGTPIMTAIGNPTISGYATACGESTLAMGDTVSCSGSYQYAGHQYASTATAVFGGGLLGLTATTYVSGGLPSSASASYDQWFTVTGGSGTGELEMLWAGGGAGIGGYADIAVSQNGVAGSGNGAFWITSPFVYGTPFDISGVIHVFGGSAYQIDGGTISATMYLVASSIPVETSQTFSVQRTSTVAAVPEPSADLTTASGLMILAIASRRRFWSAQISGALSSPARH
jgi:hypothetical protein